ncbi:MAG: hypothetical protein J0M35_20215 [Candidatus Obscuribacter phosphatis]|uniref:Uncharacterized protein n=1 Tax=Candidatus Obscuribacter phosphatis TaxID=1906157 RepID=A0A8J7PA81_9BACT|nr:hypothetical protein [Candidatus Obscuribacter phosphatis]
MKILKSRPEQVYPYTACLELHIMSYRDSTKGEHEAPTATVEAEILTVLLDNTYALNGGGPFFNEEPLGGRLFEKGQKLVFRFSTESCFATPASKSIEKLVGKTCVLAFNPNKESEGVRDVNHIETPFHSQKYNSADVAALTSGLNLSSGYLVNLKTALQKYIEDRWSVERIEHFCQPDVRSLPFMQSLLPMESDQVLAGRLYPDESKALGKVQWYCVLQKGVPNEYQAEVWRSNHERWVLEIGCPSDSQLTDEGINENILWQKLMNAYSAYRAGTSRKGPTMQKALGDVFLNSITNFTKDKSGRITGLKGIVANGQVLTADVSEALNISNILIDGKPNTYWTEIYSNASQRIDSVCKKTSF